MRPMYTPSPIMACVLSLCLSVTASAAFATEPASVPGDSTMLTALRPIAADPRPLWLLWGTALHTQAQTHGFIQSPPPEELPWMTPLYAALNAGEVRWLWPLFDLQDQLAVPLPVLEAGHEAAVMDASVRYHADGVVMLRLEIDEHGACQARWQAHTQAMTRRWHTQGPTPPACVQEGLALLSKPVDALFAPILAEIPAISEDSPPADEQVILIAIDGVRHYGDMVQLRQLMARQASLHTVKISAVYPQRVIFQAVAALAPEALAQVLATSPTLEPLPEHINTDAPAGTHHHFLGFRLIP